MKLTKLAIVPFLLAAQQLHAEDAPIIHDAEYYILKSQYGEQWVEDDAAVDEALAKFKEQNGKRQQENKQSCK